MNEKGIKDMLKRLDKISIPDKDKILSNAEKAFEKESGGRIAVRPRKRILIAAFASLFVACSMLTIGVLAIENREYKEAVIFFEENGLSTEGYSRSEIRKICKDISTNSFTYHLSFEAMCNAMEIDRGDLSEEEIKSLWEKKQKHENDVESELQNQGVLLSGDVSNDGVSFVFKVDVANAGTMDEVYTILEKYCDGKLEWTKKMEGISVAKVVHNRDLIIVAGTMPKKIGQKGIMCMSQSGDELWSSSVEGYADIIIGDNEISVIGNSFGQEDTLYIAKFNLNGRALSFVSNSFDKLGFEHIEYNKNTYRVPGYSIKNALKVEDKYYLVLENNISSGKSDTTVSSSMENLARREMSIARVSSDGRFEVMYRLNESMKSHRITDIAFKDGELYLCGYYMPSINGPLNNGLLIDKTEELDNIEEKLLTSKEKITNEKLVELLCEEYTGFVMRCDMFLGEVKETKYINGARDSKFLLNFNGELILNCKYIADAEYEIVESGMPGLEVKAYARVDILYDNKNIDIS